jgi:dipeptidyl aminopeptidase/acylaminoacyl peptidase
MRRAFFYITAVILLLVAGWFLHAYYIKPASPQNPITQIKPRPYDKYTIENLSKTAVSPVAIIIEGVLSEEPSFTSSLFSFNFDPTLQGKAPKKVTGLINIPKGKGPYPVVVMFRGYVDQKLYKTGDGTERAGEYFAKNGFITIAPDFLGYGQSDSEAGNIFESRFQTYTTAMETLASVSSLSGWDKNNIFIWGHSNGGQIALSLLEITGYTYPTVLWAPVSRPFPYSILYYTDESDDRGKLIRHELADFEQTYDVEAYSLDNYLDRIKAPIQLHQGSGDDAVPKDWSDSLNKKLETLEVDIEYFIYPGADHNLAPSWNTVVERNLMFFRNNLLTSGR